MYAGFFTIMLWVIKSINFIKSFFKSPINKQNNQNGLLDEFYYNKDDKSSLSKDEKQGLVIIMIWVVGLFFLAINLLYYIFSSIAVNNIWFTILSVLLVIYSLKQTGKIFINSNELANGRIETMITLQPSFIMNFIVALQLGWFGYFIFTGKQLINLIR